MAIWQWANYLHAQVPPGKKALLVNFDETAICAYMGGGKGNLFVRKAVQRLPKTQQRTYMTFVAFICDDPVLQQILPQVIVANTHTISARELEHLQEACPANIKILRQQSAWVDQKLCAQILRWLGEALGPYMREVQPIIFFDACRAHIARTSV